MNNQEAWAIYKRYLDAWNTADVAARVRIADEVLADDLRYQTARHDWSTGRSLVIEDMASFHQKFPGGHFEIGGVSTHHDASLLLWVIIQADGTEFARGGDQITVGRDGKISKIVTFAPFASGTD